MPKSVPSPPPGFDQLSTTEQIEYVQSLWERIAASPALVPTPDWHLDIIRRRLHELEQSPQAGRPWEEVRAEIVRTLRPSASG